MNSEGCTLTIPKESQRRAPLTSRPNPGTSSRTRSATPSTNSHGAARCHSRMGTWNTSMPATTLAAKNSACRSRKYPDFPSVNLLASASAIEAEYTITIPKVSSRSDAHSTPLSYSAGSERPGLMLLSIDDSLHGLAERFAAVPVIAEHVEARAGGRKEHRVARTRRVRGEAHRFLHACGAADRNACSGDSGFDQRRVAADQNECAHRSRERVGGVVQADKLHFANREEQVCVLREPGLAAALDETPVLGAPWDVESESDRLSSGQRHRQAARVAPVEDLDAVARKDPRLGAGVVVEAAVAVQMVFGDVKDRGGVGGKRVRRLELEARELQHPQARGPSQVLAAHERIEHRRADIAGDLAVGPRGFRHRAGKRRDGALAVGARHRDYPRLPARHRLREQLDIAEHFDTGDHRSPHAGLRERHSGADSDEIDSGETFLAERAAIGRDARERPPQIREPRRRGARVRDAHDRPAAREPLRHRQARVTQTEHQRLSARETHRSFKVDRPNSTSIMVMIQKRTTT